MNTTNYIIDKISHLECDKMLKAFTESFKIIYYGNTAKTCYVDTVQSLQDAWSVISKDRYDMQSFHRQYGYSHKKQNYEVWQGDNLVVQVTYDK